MVVMSSAQGLPVLALQEGPAAGKEPNPTCSPSARGTASLLCHGTQRELSAPPEQRLSSQAPLYFRAGYRDTMPSAVSHCHQKETSPGSAAEQPGRTQSRADTSQQVVTRAGWRQLPQVLAFPQGHC